MRPRPESVDTSEGAPIKSHTRSDRQKGKSWTPGALFKQHRRQQRRDEQRQFLAGIQNALPPTQHRRGRMAQGELYQYYKRQGLLAVYYALFPGG